MDVSEALARLEAAGTEQNRKVYQRHGVRPPLFGVSYAELGKLRKAIKVDHALAVALWASGNHDARILATMVDDPRQTDKTLLDAWARDLDNYVLTDAFTNVAAAAPGAHERMRRWIDADAEWVEQAGWGILGAIANGEPALPDSFFEPYLARIERDIHGAKNRVRHTMNMALICIGSRSAGLAATATAAADRIGKVTVDHGETGCKTPLAGPYIQKTRAHRAAKAAAKG
jgi:3-methyladenine DNA glycosylase AlkD